MSLMNMDDSEVKDKVFHEDQTDNKIQGWLDEGEWNVLTQVPWKVEMTKSTVKIKRKNLWLRRKWFIISMKGDTRFIINSGMHMRRLNSCEVGQTGWRQN